MASPSKAYMSEPATALTANILPEQSLFRIGEVARLTATKPFVLRYWETEFPTLQPVKSPSGHRLYRREDVQTVLEIRRLLYDEGFTIAGARRHLRERAGEIVPASENDAAAGAQTREDGAAPAASARAAATEQDPLPTISRKVLLDLRDTLRAFLTLLETE
jgi:DNA-binding transcriptional MerR regulator